MNKSIWLIVIILILFPAIGRATVNGDNSTVSFTCTGTTGPYSFTFPISDATALDVIENGTTLLSTAYTIVPVNNNYNNGGSVTLNVACPGGDRLVLQRSTPLTQLSVFTDNMPIPFKTFENALDKLTEAEQDIVRDVGQNNGGVPIYTVATLPTSALTGTVVSVSDGASGSDCTVGGGTTPSLCAYDGSAWIPAGGGSGRGTITGCSTSGGVAYENGTAETLTCGLNLTSNTPGELDQTVDGSSHSFQVVTDSDSSNTFLQHLNTVYDEFISAPSSTSYTNFDIDPLGAFRLLTVPATATNSVIFQALTTGQIGLYGPQSGGSPLIQMDADGKINLEPGTDNVVELVETLTHVAPVLRFQIGDDSGHVDISAPQTGGTTPNPLILPIVTGGSGQVLSTDGGNPQQTSWITAGRVVGSDNQTAEQTGNYGPITLLTSGSATGFYLVTIYCEVSTGVATSTITTSIGYHDDTGAQTQTGALFSAATTGTIQSLTFPVRFVTGTVLTYSTTTTNSPKYKIFARVQAL